MTLEKDRHPVKIEICPLCGGSGLVEKGDETDTCPLCKGVRKTPRKGEAVCYGKGE